MDTKEGFISFEPQPREGTYQTFFKVMSLRGTDRDESRVVSPLILVHGGPTFGHDYLLPFQALIASGAVSCLIFYDQIGCGKSTVVAKKEDRSFWNLHLLHMELINLISKLGEIVPAFSGSFSLLGHSVGSMIAASVAAEGHAGLQNLILSNGMASIELLQQSCATILNTFPLPTRHAIRDFEENQLGISTDCRTSLEQYNEAVSQIRATHGLRAPPPYPSQLIASLQNAHQAVDVFKTL